MFTFKRNFSGEHKTFWCAQQNKTQNVQHKNTYMAANEARYVTRR